MIWNSGVLSRLPEPAGTEHSDAYEINADGRVVGGSTDAGGQLHALYWDGVGGAPQPARAALSGTRDFSQAIAVDDAGDVVGNTLDVNFRQIGFFARMGTGSRRSPPAWAASSAPRRSPASRPDGTTMLGHVNGDSDHQATTGWYLFNGPSDGGLKLDLNVFQTGASILGAASTPQFANLMASDGAIVGYKGADATSGTFYLRSPSGSEQQITGLIGHNGVNAKHTVIGTILGTYQGQQVPHAAIWRPDGTVVDLNNLPGANPDLVLYDPLAINDNGDIVGLAGQISTQQEVGFLLPAGYVVDSILDDADKTPGDGNCATAAGACTLRAALQEVDAAKVDDADGDLVQPARRQRDDQADVAAPGRAVPGGDRRPRQGRAARHQRGWQRLGADPAGRRVDGSRDGHRGLPGRRRADRGVRRLGRRAADQHAVVHVPVQHVQGQREGRVAVFTGTQNDVDGNRMKNNARPAIDLGADGRTPNDAKDADAGANGLHNFPIGVLRRRTRSPTRIKVSGVDPAADAGERSTSTPRARPTRRSGAEPTDYVGSMTVGYMGGWKLDVPAVDARRPTRSSPRRCRRGRRHLRALARSAPIPTATATPTPTATACATRGRRPASTPTTTARST